MSLQLPSVPPPVLLPIGEGPPPPPPPIPTAYTVADVPISINLKPTWAYSRGAGIRRDCLGALRAFPTTGPIPPLYDHQAAIQGECGLGIYVTNPAGEQVNFVDETWNRVFLTLWCAIHFLVGSFAAGWSLTLRSGVQLMFFEPAITPGFGKEVPDMGTNLEDALDQLAPPRPPDMPTAVWMDMPPDPASQATSSGQAITAIPTAVSTNGSLLPTTITEAIPASTNIPAQVPFLVPYAMRAWTAWPPPPLRDCKNALKPFFLFSWLFGHAGANFERPFGNTRGRCTVAIFLTNPPTVPLRVRPSDVNVYHEAWQLALATVFQQGAGGFMDLPNGVQVLIYERRYIDPANVCPFMTRISLRACLENRAQANSRSDQRISYQVNHLESLLDAAMRAITAQTSTRTTSATSTGMAWLEAGSQVTSTSTSTSRKSKGPKTKSPKGKQAKGSG